MKPKTKLQKKVTKLSLKVPNVSDEDKQWANDALFDGYYVQVRNRNYCLECGHKWNPDCKRTGQRTCPGCGVKLKHIDNWDSYARIYEYWAIIDVVEGFQVVRMFMTTKYLKRKQQAKYSHQEVMQHWVREDGKRTTLSKLCGMQSWYYDDWSGSDLEVRSKSRNHRMRCNIVPFKIRPGRNTLPIIRRNGYKGYFKGQAPHLFFSAILKHPKAETLLKAGQESLFKFCVSVEGDVHDNIEKYWDSICIAMRNDYIVEGASDWFDYLGMLEEFGKDLHNPHYICPKDFDRQHQRYVKKRKKKRKAEAEKRRRKKIKKAQEEYLKTKSKYFDVEINSGDIEIIPMKSVKEVIELGDRLHHCLGLRYAKKEHSLILGAYKGEQPLEAIEINLNSMEIIQARGLQNKATEHHDKIVNAVRENMGKIARRNQKREVAA